MKGEKIYKIFDLLENNAMSMADFTTAFLSAGYGASMGKIDYEFNKKNRDRTSYQIQKIQKRQLEQYIYKLKSDGLLKETIKGKMKISTLGRKKMEKLRKIKFLDKDYFHKEKGTKVVIISYDLPISFNRERGLLREVLHALGFHKIHQSVWVGKVRVPPDFIHGLQKLNILRFVEILEVTKHGSLKPI